MLIGGGGGGTVQAEYGPMQSMSDQLSGQADSWSATFAAALPTSGNPMIDGALSDLGSAFLGSARSLSDASSATACFVNTTSGNFASADGS